MSLCDFCKFYGCDLWLFSLPINLLNIFSIKSINRLKIKMSENSEKFPVFPRYCAYKTQIYSVYDHIWHRKAFNSLILIAQGVNKRQLTVILKEKCGCVCVFVASPTLSPEADVRTKVEKTGSWYFVFRGQLSTVTPMGRQKTGTDSGRGNASRSSSGYRLIRPAAHSS